MPTFSYEVQTGAGQALSGELAAETQADAQRTLEGLQLRVLALAPAVARARRPGRITTADFQAFNQQLASLTAAGLPVEQGLQLIAREMGRGALAGAIRDVAAELERGVPLADAF